MSEQPKIRPVEKEPSLSLGDRIAIDAMCAYLGSSKFSCGYSQKEVAKFAYDMADAMLAERERHS